MLNEDCDAHYVCAGRKCPGGFCLRESVLHSGWTSNATWLRRAQSKESERNSHPIKPAVSNHNARHDQLFVERARLHSHGTNEARLWGKWFASVMCWCDRSIDCYLMPNQDAWVSSIYVMHGLMRCAPTYDVSGKDSYVILINKG